MKKSMLAVAFLFGTGAMAAEVEKVRFDAQFDAETRETGTVSFTFIEKAPNQELVLEPASLGNLVGVKHLWRGTYKHSVPFRGGKLDWTLLVSKTETEQGEVGYWVQAANGNHVAAGVGAKDLSALSSLMANGNTVVLNGRPVVARFIATFQR